MSAKKIEKKEVEIVREYNVPLRKEFSKAPVYKKANRAVSALRHFIIKHMKNENVIISNDINEYIWKNGIKNPPHHIAIKVSVKDSKVYAELNTKKNKRKSKKMQKSDKKLEEKKRLEEERMKQELEKKKKEEDAKKNEKETFEALGGDNNKKTDEINSANNTKISKENKDNTKKNETDKTKE